MPINYLVGQTEEEPIQVQEKNIPYGNQGILVSAGELVKIIKMFRKDQERIRPLAEQITRNCRAKDYLCEAKSIYTWVKSNIKFLRDPYRVEMLRSPIITLDRQAGDCDDHTILVSSLLQSIGFPTRIVLVATRSTNPKAYNHVFSEVMIPISGDNKWLPIDTTPLDSVGGYIPFGVLPQAYLYRRIEVN